jgi:hypothetical protein
MTIDSFQPSINLSERSVQVDLRATDSQHLQQVAPPRSEGVHVSTLIRSIAIKTGKLKDSNKGSRFKMDNVIDDKDFPLVMAMGMAWEDWISRQYPQMAYHIGELELDNIYMSPDGITIPSADEFDFDLGVGIVEEFKLTYKSARKPIEAQWMWLSQVMAYCKALPTLCARLHVVYVNGDYDYNRPGLPPQYIVYNLQFTQEELDINWNMILTEYEDQMIHGEL